jgi:hypothetical protein
MAKKIIDYNPYNYFPQKREFSIDYDDFKSIKECIELKEALKHPLYTKNITEHKINNDDCYALHISSLEVYIVLEKESLNKAMERLNES